MCVRRVYRCVRVCARARTRVCVRVREGLCVCVGGARRFAARRPAAGALIWRQANQSSNNRTFVRTT